MIKVFEITSDGETDTVAADSQEQAINCYLEETGLEPEDIEEMTEIPEWLWDDTTFLIYEDNDRSMEPFETTLREQLVGVTIPCIIASTYEN